MKTNTRKLISVLLCILVMFSLTGCADKSETRYQEYVNSLLAINYLGATEDYVKSTGANQEDADALYQANLEHLADNIMTYYNVTITDAPEMRASYVELAKNIYSKSNYQVSKARKDGSVYLVDVTIYPMNIFSQASEDVIAYVDSFNQRVRNGDYNDTSLTDYETEFSTGMIELLNSHCVNMTYLDPVVITVEIIEDGNTYYISDKDFIALDQALIAASITTQTEPTDNTEPIVE